MILRTAPYDVSRTRHPLGLPGRRGSRVVPAHSFHAGIVARGAGFVARGQRGVLD